MQYCLLVQMALFIVLLCCLSTTASGAEAPMAKPKCLSRCGNVSIPYPFGIGPNRDCYFDEGFEISCNKTTGNVPVLRQTGLEVLNISIANGTIQVKNPVTFFCAGNSGRQPANLTGTPFVYSARQNRFTAVSCGHVASVSSDAYFVGGCRSICEGTGINYGNCEVGINCCQTTIPPHLSAITIRTVIEKDNRGRGGDCNNDYAFLVDKNWFWSIASVSNFSVNEFQENVPVVLRWSLNFDHTSDKLFHRFIGRNESRADNDPMPCCTKLNATPPYDQPRLQCSCPRGFEGNPYLGDPCHVLEWNLFNYTTFDIYGTTNSTNSTDMDCTGGSCFCSKGFQGNPYLLHGCEDIDECEDPVHFNRCIPGFCINYPGRYQCVFPDPRQSQVNLAIIVTGTVVGLLFLLVGAWWLRKVIKKRKNIKRKEKFFKQNGGLLLKQQLSSGEVNVEKIKLFNSKELEKATDNFSADRILGQGGQGTVYKGMLADGRIVAVKKSKIVAGGEVGQFINEIVILSQISHRNVVKLLGCCLETEVPLLVYEFILNGTLSQYIHHQNEEFPLTWEMRLRVSIEVAGALSYLHSAASFPIYHRDIKAKVADFGTSRSVAIDQTHLTTRVHGTFGYLDPEYFQSSQFTEKSDVYSFGVVLAELLTGEKPVSVLSSQESRSLATYFLLSMEENRLFDILHAQVMKEAGKDEIMAVANLAQRCLNLNGKKRPTMKEVAAELEAIQLSVKYSNVQQNFAEVHYVRSPILVAHRPIRRNCRVLNISAEGGTLRVTNPITFLNCSNKPISRQTANLEGSPFAYSTENVFTAVGCGFMATITFSNSNGYSILSGCKSECDNSINKSNGTRHNVCNGVDCCQTAIPSFLSAFNTSFQRDDDYTRSSCNYAFLVDREWFQGYANNLTNTSAISERDNIPVVLEWKMFHSTTEVFGTFLEVNVNATMTREDPIRPQCDSYHDNSSAYGSSRLECTCGGGSEGNPYLLDGCQDINECEVDKHSCSEPYVCVNSPYGYSCMNPPKRKSPVKAVIIGIGSGLGFLLLLLGAWWLHKLIKKTKAIKRKKKFFEQNGGILLEQQLAAGEVNVEKIKLFNSQELEIATDHFNIDRILGQGGQGTVYKGMLTDGRIVAVKKSKLVDGGEVVQFINEITEVPLLVYEFIPKGTIYQYLHEENEEFLFTWEMRLRIAAEVAGALSYLHSAAGFPIYHRDIKSTNILLDDKYRAKVADFGTSRSVSIDQTHLTTIVHGTFGYLDPEYFQSSQFTDKSDVYSFGVVLLELLTGEKSVSLTRSPEIRGLVTYFNFTMEENRLFDIIDARVKEEGATEDILSVANLANRCLDMSGKRRPTMKEVAMELERIQKSVKSSNNLQQNYDEVEYVRNESIVYVAIDNHASGCNPPANYLYRNKLDILILYHCAERIHSLG
ncbi:wall-associated receptor kinase-like 1 [Pyrus ussuriensis x Pyrus communis]|uniref:Wall-associated receptor kinase-like 1 n=1 Tax=Pyrus ussuriensis x Pyrus communis TaxID=2448454 RepID=A0A5N5GDG6_9ROSA|nr:wall-associated receptor kinase-like 1 [Pyrus ussuriensis x Pyrus communis]